MPYSVVIRQRVHREIARWKLPDTLRVECYFRLRDLSGLPALHLTRTEHPFDGMVLEFEISDLIDRFVVHRFTFQAVYGMDEETLFIEAATHKRFTLGS